MSREHRQPGPVALVVMATTLLGLCAVLWIAGTVPSGGPDEPSHIIRGAGLVRGQLDGVENDQSFTFDVPAWVGDPDPRCFQLQREQPATCATGDPRPTGDARLRSTAYDYPIWGHLAPGLGTYLPSAIGNSAARLFDAAIPIGLFIAGFALAARSGLMTIGAASLAITPMVWFSVIVVNPSGLAIAGGFALWAAMLSSERLARGHADRLVAWTMAAGWAAASLPRRDGAIWAALIVAICATAGVADVRRVATRLGVGPVMLIGASVVASTAWAATSDTSSSKALVLAPLLPVVGIAVRAGWVRSTTLASRVAIVSTLVASVLVVLLGVVATRPGGYDGPVFERVLNQTGSNIEEAIGLLGWLDTPVPRLALFGWFVALGIVIGAVLIRGGRFVVGLAAAVLGIGIAMSWILELTRGASAGMYWQGRYYLPLLVGVPMVLGWPRSGTSLAGSSGATDVEHERAVGAAVLATALSVLTLTFGASMRRWALGNGGSLLPWTWDTYGTIVPPALLLLAHAVVCGALYLMVTRYSMTPRSEVVRPLDTVTTHER